MQIRLPSFVLIILNFQLSLAQSYNYVSYTSRDGLAGNMVYDMCQDNQGFLWFGTDNGLSRFDGKNFVNYTVKDGIMDNEVLLFSPDSHGRLWIGTFSHELVYYLNGKFHNRFNDTMLAKVELKSRPINFHEEADQTLWIICQNQVFYWPKNGVFKEYDIASLIGRRPNEDALVFKYLFVGEKLALTIGDSIYTLNENRFSFNSIFRTKSGISYVWSKKSIKDTVVLQLEHDIIRTTGRAYVPYLIGTVNGAIEIDTISSKIVNRYLPGKGVTRALKDFEGNYWFSTLGDGTFKLTSKTALTYSITNELSALNEVFSIGKRNDSILTGHSGGRLAIWKYGKLESLTSYQEYLPEVENSISTNRLKVILPVPDGGWLLGFDGFLIYQKGKLRKILPMTATKTIDLVNDTTIIVATGQDVRQVNLNSFKTSKVLWFSRATSAVNWNGNSMIGTLSGLKAPENKIVSDLIIKEPILQRRIIGLNKFRSSLWVATSDAGLVELTAKGTGRTINENDGLPSNNCRTLFIDGDIMWVGTNKGLASINLADPEIKILIYNQYNLLPNDAISSVFSENGKVYVGSPNGLTIFEPKKTNAISICGLSIDAIKSSTKTWELNEQIVLNRKDNFLQIQFAGISAKAAGNIDYYFKLDGVDDVWSHTLANQITFSNLPNGNYTFQLFAQNKFGVKSKMHKIEILVVTPFWKTKWFLLVAFLLGSFIIYLMAYTIFGFKNRRAELFKKVQRQLADLEQKALQSQMNPHFIFNSLNSIQQYIVTNKPEDANKYLSIFASLIRETLENSTFGNITVSKEILYLEKYLQLEQLRFGNRFIFKIVSDSLKDKDVLKMPVMLLQPFVENAVRHGMRYRADENGLIIIEFKLEQNTLHCLIIDNGPGREKTLKLQSRQHIEYQSRGMDLTQKRIDILNILYGEKIRFKVRDLNNDEGIVSGTEVHIEIDQIEIDSDDEIHFS